MGKIRNTKVNSKVPVFCVSSTIIVSSLIIGGGIPPSLQYSIKLLHGTMWGRHDRNGLCSRSFLSF